MFICDIWPSMEVPSLRTNLECVFLVMMVHFLSGICGYVFSCFAMPVLIFIETR